MKLGHLFSIAIASFVAITLDVTAETIFGDDFQDGNAEGWGAAGDGDIGLSTYAGNVSMRMTKKAMTFAAITTQGYADVRIAASFAAGDLEGNDACIFEASADEGQSWVEVLSVKNGQDDLVTMHRGSVAKPQFDDLPRLILRARVAGNSGNDTCWLDGVSVTGRWMADQQSRLNYFSSDMFGSDAEFSVPASTSAYAPAEGSEPAAMALNGRLIFAAAQPASGFEIYIDRSGLDGEPDARFAELPAFDFEYTTEGDRLIPKQRGLIARDHPFWEYVLTPGRIWSEAGGGIWTRAALPFALVEKNANCTHNGLLIFRFNAEGEVSDALWQVGSETCAYFQFDAWGRLELSFEPHGRDAERPSANMQDLTPVPEVRAISTLASDHPGVLLEAIAAPEDVSPEFLTVYGLVLDGVHYVSECQTRYGPYPFCDEMVIPSYSFAKSLFAGLALMRLEHLHPGAKDAFIADYVPECAHAGHWDDVTFQDALNMTTGRYASRVPDADENRAVDEAFFIVETHIEKIELACTQYPRKSPPGEVWVYHTTDTYILGTAMAAFMRRHVNAAADIYRDLLVDPLWSALGLSETLSETRRTYDENGQPFVGWGLVFERDDLARLLVFLQHGSGQINGTQVLDANMLGAALQRDPGNRGLPATNNDFRYKNGFWAWNYADFGGCEGDAWISFMSGFGGLSAVLMPNGVSYYYVSDGNEYAWGGAVRATNAYAPICEDT